jgi:phenylpropionate dioxygenase-like ring-hydroxylating dioxygenase large terminal subunit
MDDLIQALQILRKYGNQQYPTNCEHGSLWVNIENEDVSEEDVKTLDKLGFIKDEEYGGFVSFRFG